MLSIVRFLTQLVLALALALPFAHAAEIVGKLRLPGPVWITVQHNLYVGFAWVGAIVEIGAILLTWTLFFLLRRRRPGAGWMLVAALCVSVALPLWAIFINPINVDQIAVWTPETLPPDWTDVRDRWEMWHAIRAALFAIAFCAATLALLADTPRGRDRDG